MALLFSLCEDEEMEAIEKLISCMKNENAPRVLDREDYQIRYDARLYTMGCCRRRLRK
jgi:hypothetical protein